METVRLEVGDRPCEAYLSLPGGDRPVPGVLFLMDAFGLRPQLATMTDRIASWGYAVLAPNLFHASGTVAALAPTRDLREPGARQQFLRSASGRVSALTPAAAADDMTTYLRFLQAHPRVTDGALGLTGYCMGARHALVVACDHPQEVAAVGGWHGGRLATDAPGSPHLRLGSARAAFAFGHAQGDRSMLAADVERLGAALAGAGLAFSNEVFPGPHGYTMADTSAYSAAADALHWQRLEALLASHLA